MKKSYIYIALISLVTLSACVENPNVTEDVYLENNESTSSWVNGLKRQLALTMNQVVINSEMVSDNYYNNYTQYSKVFDIPQIDFTDLDVNRTQVAIGALREMAEYGIETVLPNDNSATDKDWSYVYFAKAYALILAGENFSGLPEESNGPAISSESLLQNSLIFLDNAIEKEDDVNVILAYELLKARVYRNLGDVVNAKFFANRIIGNTDLLFQLGFDGTNGVINEIQNATFTATENRFAPLPRLDFLDPKFYDEGTSETDQKPLSLAKAEEAYLILAEAYVSDNDISNAKTILVDLINNVIAERAVDFIDDSAELRNGSNRLDYPTTAVLVSYKEGDEFKSGLVLDRQAGDIPVYTVSGTSLTENDIEQAENGDDVLYLIYLLRQEVFMSEGRRSNDLGIKFPVSQTEQLNNSNITDEFIEAIIPSFIPLSLGLDNFHVDPVTGNITIEHDMNAVLVANKASEFVLPFN